MAKPQGVNPDHFRIIFKDDIAFEISRQFMLYCERVEEEKAVLSSRLSADRLRPVFARLPNLKSIKVLNGRYKLIEGRFEKDWYAEDYDPELPTNSYLQFSTRGEALWRVSDTQQKPAQYQFETVIKVLSTSIEELEVNLLLWRSFEEGCFLNGGHVRLTTATSSRLTKLHLTIAVQGETNSVNEYWDNFTLCRSTMRQGVLKEFLAALKNVRDLKIAFPCTLYGYESAVDLADVMPHHRSGLVSLDLHHFETMELFIIDFLRNNRRTLKILALRHIYLNPRGSWVTILGTVRRRLYLKSARMSGQLCDPVYPDTSDSPSASFDLGKEDGWDFDQDTKGLSAAVGKYMVEGGPCPLHHNDKVAVQEGMMDPVAELVPSA